MTGKPFLLSVYKSQFPADKCCSLQQTKLILSFSGHQADHIQAFNDQGPMQRGNISDMNTSTLL